MSISMIGVDHNMAPVDIRALFAFTKKKCRRCNGKTKGTGRNPGMYSSVYL